MSLPFTPSPPVPDSFAAFAKDSRNSFNTSLIIGVVLSVIWFMITVVGVIYLFKRLKGRGGRLGMNLELFPPGNSSQAYSGSPHDVESNSGAANRVAQSLSFTGLTVIYTFQELHTATNGFSRRLGAGAFGAVYEGILRDGSKVAVKLLNGSGNERDFRAEVETLGTVHHRNVVRLRGFCAEAKHRLLVYDFMPGGSLDSWLFAPRQQQQQQHHASGHSHSQRGQQEAAAGAGNGNMSFSYRMRPPLPWEVRMHIALGSAKGLAYLHEECAKRIIHLDIKPHNILLDNEFNPKVADFGLAKLMDWGKSMVETVMQGTPGYLAPEWLVDGAATPKMDVYSLGIVFLELVSGRRVMEESIHLRDWTMQLVKLGQDLEVADPRLKGEFHPEQVKRMIQIALWCVQTDPSKRPAMRDVVQMIEQPQGAIDLAPLDPHSAFLDPAALGSPWQSSQDSGSRTSLLNR